MSLDTLRAAICDDDEPDQLARITVAEMQEIHEADENPRYIRDQRYSDLLHAMNANPALLEARPVVVDAAIGDVPCGNMRLRAALDLAGQTEGQAGGFHHWLSERGFPVYVKAFRDANERREWMLLDNQPFGEWVPDELAGLVAMHQQEDGDMRALGFAEHDVSGLLALAANAPAANPRVRPDEGDAPEPEPPGDPADDRWTLKGVGGLIAVTGPPLEEGEEIVVMRVPMLDERIEP